MAKKSIIAREAKRQRLVAKYATIRKEKKKKKRSSESRSGN